MYLISERVDYFIETNGVEPYLFARLGELKVDPIAFVSEYWRQNKDEHRINLKFIRYGFKYNHLFNERLGRALDHPTWREFVIDCLAEPMQKNRIEIDRAMWSKHHPGEPLPKELEYSYQKNP